MANPNQTSDDLYALPPMPAAADNARFEPVSPQQVQAETGRAAAPSRADVIRRAVELDVDPRLALSIWSQESSSGRNPSTSDKGAIGGFQVMPGTGRAMIGNKDLSDPWNNMEAGLRYIAYGQKTLGTRDPALLAAGYHAGYDRKDLKAGVIPGTSDGHITTAAYAAQVAGRAGGTVPDVTGGGRFEPIAPSQAATLGLPPLPDASAPKNDGVDDHSRYETLSPADLTKLGIKPVEIAPPVAPAAKAPEPSWSDKAGYLGKSLKAGAYDLLGAGARVLDAVNPWTLSESDAAVLFKNDPAKLKEFQDNSSAMILSRFAHAMTSASEDTMKQAPKAAQDYYKDKVYATTDPSKAAYLEPTKVISDAVRSLPTMAALAITTYFTRGAATQAERTALAEGMSAEAARAAAVQAGAKAAAKVGATSEGVVGYGQQAEQTWADASKTSPEDMAKSPVYQDYLKRGFTPEAARAKVIADTAEQSGQIAGIVDAAVNHYGGHFLGKILSEGGSFVPRVMKGFANEAATETIQSGGEQYGQNLATKQNIKPDQDLTEGVAENMAQGFAVGGVSGGAAAGIGGRGHDGVKTQAAPQQAPATPTQAAPQPPVAEQPAEAAAQPAAPVAPAAPAPEVSTAAGPLTRSVENAADKHAADAGTPRVTVTGPNGASTEGQVLSYKEDGQGGFTAEIVSEDGEVVTLSDKDGVTITPQAHAAGPLSGAVQDVAEEESPRPATEAAPQAPAIQPGPALWRSQEAGHPVTVLGVEPQPGSDGRHYARVEKDGQQSFVPADELIPAKPAPDAKAPDAQPAAEPVRATRHAPQADLSAMTEAELRERMRYVTQQAKNAGGWDAKTVAEKKRIEKEINARVEAAQAKAERAPAAVPTGPFTTQADANAAMLKAAEATGQAHEVVPQGDQFTIQPIKEEAHGSTGLDAGHGRGDGGGAAVLDGGDLRRGTDGNGRVPASAGSDAGAARSETAAPAAGASQPADAKPALKAAPAKDAHAGKWFGSQDKAAAYVSKKGIADTHEVVQTGKVRFEVKPKQAEAVAQVTPEPVAEAKPEAVAQPAEKPARTTLDDARAKHERQDAEVTKAKESLAKRKAEKETAGKDVAPAADAPTHSPLLQARNDLMEMQAQAEAQGQIVDDRLLSKIRQQKQVIKELEAEQSTAAQPAEAQTAEPVVAQPKPAANDATAIFAKNKVFTADAVEKARARLKSKMGQINSGIDPEVMVDGVTLAGAYIEAGVRRFGDFAKAMVDDLGPKIKPFLLSFYEGVRHYPGLDTDGMSTPAQAKELHHALLADVAGEANSPTIENKEAGHDTEPTEKDAGAGAQGPAAEPVRAPESGGDAGRGGEPGRGERGAIDRRSEAAGDRGGDDAGQAGLRGRPATAVADAGEPVQGGRGDGAEPGRRGDREAGKPASRVENYRIGQGELARDGSWKKTAERNVEIVELVKKITAEGRLATPEERAKLVKFTGWGASEIANGVFPDRFGRYKDASWQALGERLKSALSDEEYAQAKRTTQYAHYTSEGVIRSIYAGLQRMGFAGGTLVEPGMGVGHFAGLMPDGIAANSHYTGIEYEPITGAIAKLLYPASNIQVGDYTRTNLPRDFFDAAIGNPPFSQTVIANDAEYKALRPMLHDYFFMKTIDRVKPGGLLVFVTSKGTMDKASDKSRRYLAERANLLGAVRLPQTAFKDNAGTEVVTDVIFLQKRGDGIPDNGVNWLNTKEVSTPQGATSINEYFADHPDMVLGQHALTGSMYRANEYTVLPREGDIEAHFAKALENLPENVTRPAPGSLAEKALVQDRDFNPKHKKEGGLYLDDKGKLMQVEDGSGVEVTHRAGSDGKAIALTPKQKQWLKGYVGVRDALKQAQFDQLNDGDWQASLKALNDAYDGFVKEHGPILDYTVIERTNPETGETTETKRFKNEPLLRLDTEGALAYALENIKEDGTIVKGAALNERVLEREREPEIKTTNDALFVSLNRHGRLDLDDVARLAGTDKDSVIRDLGTSVYEAPGKGWQLADEYLSGNVVRKLKEAQAAAEINPKFKRNVDALLAVQPRPLGPTEITVRLGTNWVPASDIASFARDVLEADADITYNALLNTWNVEANRVGVSEFGFDRMRTDQILEAVLNNRQIKLTFKDSEGHTYPDIEGTEKANDIAGKMRQRFQSWLWTDPARADRLTRYYNEHFNNIAPRAFDGSHLTLPGVSSRFKLYPHQKRAVWRVIQQGDVYLAHAVGAGKTMEMIASGMEERRLGLVNKPMYVVPNHMLAQFSREFLELYPAAQIMVADEANFHTHNRKRFVAQAALNNPDAIVITHSAFGRIAMSDEFSQAFIQKQIDAWQEALDEAKGDRITTKQIERRIEQLERRLEGKQGKEKKDKVLDFEELGVDKLYVDEFHEFRKLDFATNQGNVKGVDPNGSARALDMMMKTQYLRDKKPGRALVAASGTPVTNTMGELYTAQRFFQPEQLKEDGLETFDAWSSQYGDIVTGFEQNAAGGYDMVSRFAKFQNVPELMRRVRSFMDILTSSNLGALVKRPDVIGGGREVIVTPVPEGYKEYQKELQSRIQAIKNRRGPPKKGEDIILNVIGDGRFSAIDMRFVDPSRPSDPQSKLNLWIDAIIKAYQDTKDYEYAGRDGRPDPIKGASIIGFSDIGLGEASAANRGFDMRGWIEQRLDEAGIPAEHVAFMRDYKQAAKKERMFADMREGKKRILIGGKEMETGTNVQKRLTHLFHLDAPWFPASVEQREGRIIRQGNQNKEVKVNAYATKGSYDSTMWGMNARKARFIEQAMNGDDSIRSMDDVSEASAFEMAAALASGDQRYMELAGLKSDVDKLERLRHAHHDEQNSLRQKKYRAEDAVQRNEARAQEISDAIAKRTPIKAGEFSAKVGNQFFDSREEFSQSLFARFKALGDDGLESRKQLGEIGGFAIHYEGWESKGTGAFHAILHLDVPGDPEPLAVYPVDPAMAVAGIATRAANQVNGLDRDLAQAKERVAEAKRTIEQIGKRLGAAFPEESLLMEKVASLNALQEELAKESKEQASADAAAATVETEQQAAEQKGKHGDIVDLEDTFSVGERQGEPLDKDGLRSSVTSGVLGPVIARLIDNGNVVLHDGLDTLPVNVKRIAGMQAATAKGNVIHLVGQNLTQQNARAVLLHEAFHSGAEKLIGTDQWNAMMKRLDGLYRQGQQSSGRARQFFDAARERVKAAEDKGAVGKNMTAEEFAAYAIEEYESAPATIRKWVDDLIGMVKAWVQAKFGRQLGAVTPGQLSALAKMALLDTAADQRGEMFGRVGELFSVNDDRTVEVDGVRRPIRDSAGNLIGNGEFEQQVAFWRNFDGETDEQGRPIVTDDARYSVAAPTRPASTTASAAPQNNGLVLDEPGRLRRIQAALQDNMNRVKQVQEKIAQVTGRPVREVQDYYGAETNRPGRIAARLEDAQKQLFTPLMEKLAKSGHTPEQLSELLHAMHAHERNEAVAKINPDMPDGGSGMTDAQAAAVLARYHANRPLHALAVEARAIAARTLELKHAYGLISDEQYTTLSDMYENYVPLKGDGEFGPKVKRAMGHEERDEHILENIARDYDQAVVVGEKNLARQSLLRLVLANPDKNLWTVGVPPKGRYVAGQVYTIKKNGQPVASFTSKAQVAAFLEDRGPEASQYHVADSAGEQVKEFVKPLQDNEVPVYVKGDMVRIQINGDDHLARQLRPLNQGQMGVILESMRKLNRFLSSIYTGYNPAFILRNATRDAMTGTINMVGHQGAGTAAKAWMNYPKAAKALAQWAATGKIPQGETGRLLAEYRAHGGKTGASYMSDIEQQGKKLSRLYEDAYGAMAYAKDGKPTKAALVASRKIVGGLAHAVEIANTATENALRLALYMQLRDEGASAGKAAQAAKTVTVDFDRKGTMTPALGAIFLFFNPAVQGTANAVKTLVKGEHKAQAWTALGAVAALGFLAAAKGMDDDKDRWLGEGWETRSKNLILNVGGHQFRMPMSQEFAPVYAFGAAMAEASRGESKMATSLRILSSFIDAYFPFNGAFKDQSDNRGMDLALAMTPTVLQPGLQVAANRNSFGSQVVPDTELIKDRPDNLKMFRGTKGSAYDAAAQGIATAGELLGAGKYENDLTKVSPETLKLLWKTYTGGLGGFIADSIGLASLATEPGAAEINDVPILKDFVHTPDVKPIRARYYDLSREAKAAITEFQQAKKAGDGEALDKLAADPAKANVVGLWRMVQGVNKAVASIRDEEVSVNQDKSLSVADKRAKLKELEGQEDSIYRDAIKAFQ